MTTALTLTGFLDSQLPWRQTTWILHKPNRQEINSRFWSGPGNERALHTWPAVKYDLHSSEDYKIHVLSNCLLQAVDIERRKDIIIADWNWLLVTRKQHDRGAAH
jgi:hypothetical protein